MSFSPFSLSLTPLSPTLSLSLSFSLSLSQVRNNIYRIYKKVKKMPRWYSKNERRSQTLSICDSNGINFGIISHKAAPSWKSDTYILITLYIAEKIDFTFRMLQCKFR